MFVRRRARQALLVSFVCLIIIGPAQYSGAALSPSDSGENIFQTLFFSISKWMETGWESVTEALEKDIPRKNRSLPPPDPEFGPWADPMG